MPLDSSNYIGRDVGAERLGILRDYMLTVDPESVKLHNWTYGRPGSCGYQACAIGRAGEIAEFRKAGFRCDVNPVYMVTEGPLLGFDAVKAFFHLDGKKARDLFDWQTYPVEEWAGAAAHRAVLRRLNEHLAASAIAEAVS